MQLLYYLEGALAARAPTTSVFKTPKLPSNTIADKQISFLWIC